MGLVLGASLLRLKNLERTVVVKGLSEREVPADVALWPIRFVAADNDVAAVYGTMEMHAQKILAFLQAAGFTAAEITVGAPEVSDKFAQLYGGDAPAAFRYSARQTVMVATPRIDLVRTLRTRLGELGKQGIVLGGGRGRTNRPIPVHQAKRPEADND